MLRCNLSDDFACCDGSNDNKTTNYDGLLHLFLIELLTSCEKNMLFSEAIYGIAQNYTVNFTESKLYIRALLSLFDISLGKTVTTISQGHIGPTYIPYTEILNLYF